SSIDSNRRSGSETMPVKQKFIADSRVDFPIPLAPIRHNTPSPHSKSTSGDAVKRENRRKATVLTFGSFSLDVFEGMRLCVGLGEYLRHNAKQRADSSTVHCKEDRNFIK